MPGRRLRFVALALIVGLSGCSWFSDDEDADAPPPEAQQVIRAQVLAQSIRSVEIGRTRNGFLITAQGTAPGLGYARPALRPRRGGRPTPDGFIEFDFVATEPPRGVELPPGNTRTRSLRADLPVSSRAMRNIVGIRVYAATGGAQVLLAPPEEG